MDKIKVVIIDDQNIFRQMLGMAIGSVPDFAVTGTYPGGSAFLEALANETSVPDIAVLDIDMPEMNGIELNALLQKNYPHIKTIMLSQHKEENLIAQLINAGAAAYLDKDCKQEELFLAIETIHKTGYYMNAAMLKSLKRKFKQTDNEANLPENLSMREVEVLRLLCMEQTNAEIADQLHLSSKTVDFHRANLLAKTNSRNVVGLVIYALKNKVISI